MQFPTKLLQLAPTEGKHGLVSFGLRETCMWNNLDFNDAALEVVQHDDDVVRVCRRVCAIVTVRREQRERVLVNQSSVWHNQQQRLLLLPVNLVDLIGAALPHLQDPGAGVRLQLEVTLQKREGSNMLKSEKKESLFLLQQIPALFWFGSSPGLPWRWCPRWQARRQFPGWTEDPEGAVLRTRQSSVLPAKDAPAHTLLLQYSPPVQMEGVIPKERENERQKDRLAVQPRLGRCCPGRSGCSQTPPSSSLECSGWGWTGETVACPGTWPWGQRRSCHQPGTVPPAPTRNGRNCEETRGGHKLSALLFFRSETPGGCLPRVH